MNKSLILAALILFCSNAVRVSAQQSLMQKATYGEHTAHALNATNAVPANYTWFTAPFKNNSAEAIAANAGYAQHPEVNLLFAETPCDNCYELVGKRTETSKTFIKEGTAGKDIMQQTSTMPMHYRDAAGNWRTIKTHLQPAGTAGVFAANEQEAPVSVNTAGMFASIGKTGQNFEFNHGLELIYAKPDGTQVSLGTADWTYYTAGDDGVYVTNAWPGIDIEMSVIRNAIKTNFYINHAMPEYADGKLLVRDHLQLDNGLSAYTSEGASASTEADFTGNLEIHNTSGAIVYGISAATVYEKNNFKATLAMLQYHTGSKGLDIALPGSYLNRAASSYPVVIDPLVSLATSSAVTGSTYSAAWTVGCPYLNPATVPANVTVTDIQFSFTYKAQGGAWLEEGASDFNLSTCRSPTGPTGLTGSYWYCLAASAGTCASTGGATYSIFADISSCIPAPQCASYNMNITMNLYQDHLTTAACATTYILGTTPLILTVFGHTVETSNVTVSGGGTTICEGASTTLATTPSYGVPPYTIVWTPGGATGSPATVSPTATTVYTVTVTDACGITATATKTITVNPVVPITGITTICVGGTTTLTDAGVTGTWSSSATGVATIGAATGIAGGIAPGTTTITFTSSAGCTTTTVLTVSVPPSAITGVTTLCSGTTTTLSNTVAGGTWSSDNTPVATIDPASGLLGGISAGTADITYSTGGGCMTSVIVTVNASPVISGSSFTNPTVCNASDGTISLTGLTASTTYIVNYTGASPVTVTITSDASGNVVITGLPSGVYTNFTVTSTAGCVSNTIPGPITLINPGSPAAPVAGSNSPVCSGNMLSLTATDATAGVTYNWTGPAGFSSALQNPTLNPATLTAAGTYSVTVSLAGCTSAPGTTVVVINPTPVITGISSTNPTTCLGTDGTISLIGLSAGVSYTVNYLANGVPATATITADGTGIVVIPGLLSTTYSNFTVTSLTCGSNTVGPITLNDPGAPPPPVISSNSPVCVGSTLVLLGMESEAGATYSWTGPGGFTSTLQNPQIPGATAAASGNYILAVSVSNCSSSSSEIINLYPAVVLTGVTADQVIQYGTTVHLNAYAPNAVYYTWMPNDGSLNNPNINNPIAAPLLPTTYTVYAMSEYGCADTASVTIGLDYNITEFIPGAFSPNNDGLNDVFKIGNIKYMMLVEFDVYNRWGQRVYHNEYDAESGWDGKFNGVPQDIGVYNYIITVASPDGQTHSFKGDVTLIR